MTTRRRRPRTHIWVPCSRGANPQVRIAVPTRLLLEGEAETITTRVTNTDTVECDITLSLVAPALSCSQRTASSSSS
jgi:hypothetical protein